MKYKRIYWVFMTPFIKKYLKGKFDRKTVKLILKNAKVEYKALLDKADDIGSDNPMASNLYSALLFLSFFTGNRDRFTADMLAEMMETMLNSPLLKKLNRFDFNKEEDMEKFKNKMWKNSEWAEKHRNKYPETWEFNFEEKHKDGCYYYFTKCPIAKFFKDNNLEDITHLFCNLDYITYGLRKGRLIRECTLAKGDDMCDFWVVGDKVENPK